MNKRIEELRECFVKHNNGRSTYIVFSKDIEFLLRIAESARLPSDHDIDSLVWCQRFINRIQKVLEVSE